MTKRSHKPSVLHDEQNKLSAMRALLFFVAVPVLVFMTLCTTLAIKYDQVVWTTWASITTFLVVGCFGPRVAQYLAPQIGRAMNAVGQSVRDARLPSKDDDERNAGDGDEAA